MILIDASTRWSHICLSLTRSQTFLAQLIKLRGNCPDYPIKKICLDNAGEFTSHGFHEHCTSIAGIFWTGTRRVNKRVAGGFFLFAGRVASRHYLCPNRSVVIPTTFIQIKPTSYQKYSMQLVFG